MFVAVPFVVLAVLGLLLAGIAGVAVALVAAAALGWAAYARADRAALAATRARPAPEPEYRRYHNLTEGLCIAAGLPKPGLYVVDDPGVNACAIGRDAKHASLVVTTGLLDSLNRVELEGVLAHELAQVKSHDTLVTTLSVTTVAPLAAALGPLGAVLSRAANPPEREDRADAAAVLLTRYPPGLAAALEKLRDGRAVVRGVRPATAAAWIASPLGPGSAPARDAGLRTPLEERIARLQEL